jgi:hypothetical protein
MMSSLVFISSMGLLHVDIKATCKFAVDFWRRGDRQQPWYFRVRFSISMFLFYRESEKVRNEEFGGL